MTAQLVSKQDPAEPLDVSLVSKSFVKQYYWILNERTDLLHQFYGPDSSVVVSESLGGETLPYVVEAKNPKDICQLLPHLFRQVVVTLTELLPQRTLGGSVMVMVTGRMAQEMWTEERCFTQVFLLAKQPTGFYIRTDTLQVHNPSETIQMLKGMTLKAAAHEAPEVEDVQHQVSVDQPQEEEKICEQEVIAEEQPEQVAYVTESDTCKDDEAPTPQDDLSEEMEPTIEEDEPVVVQSPRTPNQKIGSPTTEELQTTMPEEKKSFLEVVLGGKQGQSPPGAETKKTKGPLAGGDAANKAPAEDPGKAVPPPLQAPKPIAVKEPITKPQRPAPVRTVRNNGNKPGGDDGQDVSYGRGRGRGRGPQPGTQGRGGNGRNSGRGHRLSRNPSSEFTGEKNMGSPHQTKNEDRNLKTVFVGQLPFGQKPEAIHSAFSAFGRILGGVEGVTVRTGQTHSFAFVVFEEAASARKALEGGVKLDGEALAIKPYARRERPVMRDRPDMRGRRGGFGGRGNNRSVNGAQDGWTTKGDWGPGRDRFANRDGGSPKYRGDPNKANGGRESDTRRVSGYRPNYNDHHRGGKERNWDRSLVQTAA